MSRIRIFVSYSRADERWIQDGQFGLIPWLGRQLQKQDVMLWADPALHNLPGEDYKKKIREEIDAAQFALLLISQDFVSSPFIGQFELPWIKARVDAGNMLIIPVLVGPTLWEGEEELGWLTDRQMLPGKPTPLIEYVADVARWQNVRNEILSAIRHRVLERSKDLLPSRSLPAADGMPADAAANGQETMVARAPVSTSEQPTGPAAMPERPVSSDATASRQERTPRFPRGLQAAGLTLIIVGSLALAYDAFAFLLWLGAKCRNEAVPASVIVMVTVGLPSSVLAVWAGAAMRRADRYGLCVAGAFALIPGTSFWMFAGLPVSIWAAWVLLRHDTRAFFRRRRDPYGCLK